MRNPLNKRILRGLKKDAVKYIAIFLFLTITIGMVSGFLVGSKSLVVEFNQSFEKYNIEWGHFTINEEGSQEFVDEVENLGVKLYKDFCQELVADVDGDGQKDADLRIFRNRKEVNKVCVWDGKIPEAKGEIALDRLFMENNNLKQGDNINVGGRDYNIVGTLALPDYPTFYWDNTGFMFDAQATGGAIFSDAEFDSFDDTLLKYYYEWKYIDEPENDRKESEMATDFMKDLYKITLKYGYDLNGYVPRYGNQSIQFASEDMAGDRPMMTVLGYMLIAILAFVFAVTINQQIDTEANVIGTLRASGYTKGEIYRNYVATPMLVILFAGIIGNIFAYTCFLDVAAGLYLNSYSLTTYITHPDISALLLTTIVPFFLMFGINTYIIWKKISFSPLQFLRRDLKKKQREKAIKLNTKIPFLQRFRLRIIFQNMGSYITLLVGICFATLLLMFGMGMPNVVEKYGNDAVKNMPCKYQYVLEMEQKVPADVAEPYAVISLDTTPKGIYKKENISLYGIQENSKFFPDMKVPEEGVVVTSDFAAKYQVRKGDVITFKEPFGPKLYAFEIDSVYEYPTSMNVYMDIRYWNDIFGEDVKEDGIGGITASMLNEMSGSEETYYNGYFSDEVLEGKYLREDNVTSVVDQDSLTAFSRQMMISMGGMMKFVSYFAVIIFLLIMFMLTKLILEKNMVSISLTKILGYSDGEISGLYITSSIIVVVISAVLSLTFNKWFFTIVCRYLFAGYAGWFNVTFSTMLYVYMFLIIIASYLVIAITQFFQIRKIPMDQALKNVE